MTATTSPCFGCSDRARLCHSSCAKYSEWLTKIHAGKAKERDARMLDGYQAEQSAKYRKWMHEKN